ncbi:ComEA family DNA-binding protein [Jatrophihabitans sp. YIM 134969]
MGWRERFGADDERALIAARARALLDAAGPRPSPGASSPGDDAGEAVDAPAPTLPSPHGGWVPSPAALAVDLPVVVPRVPIDLDAPGAVPERTRRASTGAGTADRSVVPSWRDRVRFDPGRRGLVAVAAVVVVVGSVAGGVVFRGGQSSAVTVAAVSGVPPAADPVASSSGGGARSGVPGAAGSPSASPSAPEPGASAAATVTVDVAGLVVRPGVYVLPAGSRVDDALAAAGGARPGADLTTLNRARVLVDGEQLAVGVPGAPAGSGPVGGASTQSGPASGVAPGGLVDLNTAGLADLDTLPGVGPVLAQAIVDWRTDHGRFASVDDLQQVTGIGPSRFADLKDLVTV